jgi:glutathione peroxidase-family protein
MKYLLSFLIIGLMHISNTSYSQAANQATDTQAYQIGSKVEDFSMKNIDGKEYSLSSIENAKGYIVIFTSNVCPFAVAYEDRIVALHNQMAPKGYPVVAINSNDGSVDSGDSYEDMVARYKEMSFPFLYLKDEAAVYAKFGANKTPHVYLLDQDMTVRYIGAIDDSPKEPSEVKVKYVENAIAAIERGETPDPETTKAIGCPIKVKGAKGGRGGEDGPPSAENIMKRMDKNNDQKISKNEAHGPLAGDFDNLDKNKDGELTMDELANIRRR